MRKTLATLACLGSLALGSAGCFSATLSPPQASTQETAKGLLPEYNLGQIKRNMACEKRGIQEVFAYFRGADSTSGEITSLNERRIKRNFKEEERVDVIVAWRYGCTKKINTDGRTSYGSNILEMDVELYNMQGDLIDSQKGIKHHVPQKDAMWTVGRNAFLLDYNRLYSHELSKLSTGIYIVKCKLTDKENNLVFSRETSFKIRE